MPPNSVKVAIAKLSMPHAGEFAFMGGVDYWSGIEIPPVLVCTDSGLVRVELRKHSGHSRCLKPNHDLGLAVDVDKVLVSGLNGVAGESGNISDTITTAIREGRHCGTSNWCGCRSL